MKKYIGARQVRERYNDASDVTLYRWIKKGDIPPPIVISGQRYWDPAELDAHDEQCRRQAAAS